MSNMKHLTQHIFQRSGLRKCLELNQLGHQPAPTIHGITSNWDVLQLQGQDFSITCSRDPNKRECRLALYSGKGDEFVQIYEVDVACHHKGPWDRVH